MNRRMHLAGALGVLSFAAALPAFAAFSDVSTLHPHAESITYVQAEGIVSGNPDGTYKPNAHINRAEFTKIVINATTSNALQCPPVMPFIDVASNAWYTPFVCEAKARNVIGGYPDGSFRPAANINFAEAAKILAGAFAMPVESGGEWWQPYIAVLQSKNALPTSYVSPERFVTRGEMAFMIHRIKVPVNGGGGCKVAGCSGQLCVEESDDGISACEWRDEYACYRTATCERQEDGECGWTDTPELRACLTGEPTNACAAMLCPINTTCRDGQCIPIEDGSAGAYTDYTASVIGNGETSVLFFYAAWCPLCQQDDAALRGWYESQEFDRSVYKVNYDTETALKAKYGVTYQHTYVVIDGEGNMITKVNSPTDAALQKLLND